MKSQDNKNGTSTIRPKPQPRTQQQNKPKQQQPKTKMPTKGGVKIGQYKDKDKWRCITCKYMNDIQHKQCTTCGDPRPGPKMSEGKEKNIREKQQKNNYEKIQQEEPQQDH